MSEESQILVASGSGIQTVLPQLAAVAPQVVYLDFDGAETSYDNRDLDIFIDNITVDDSGFDSTDISYIVDALNAQFDDDIVFTAELPETDEYSTIYIGITSAFEEYGDFLGLAETIDSGNKIHDDNAFVFLNSTASLELVTSVIAHETEHIVHGMEHEGEGLRHFAEDIYVSSGQIVSGCIVSSDSWLRIREGGTAISTTVSSSGHLNVYSGGTANDTIIKSGGWCYVFNNGIINSTTLSSGYLWIYSGGMANVTMVRHSAQLVISGEGTANSNTLYYGYLWVWEGGIVNNTVVDFGYMHVSSGGTGNDTLVEDGKIIVYDGGVANNTKLQGFGYYTNACMDVSSGGTANDTTINSGGVLYVSDGGTANNTNINSNGRLCVSSGGTAFNVYNSFGTMCVYVSGGDSATVLLGSNADGTDFYISNGVACNIQGYLMVFSGGTANYTIINSGEYMNVSNGGMANYTTLKSGGSIVAFSGATINSTTISQGYIYVSRGATINSTTISQGYLTLSKGVTANYIILNSNGHLYVSSGATALNIVENGGYVSIKSGATTTFVPHVIEPQTIEHSMTVHSGTTAISATINSNGFMDVSSGGMANSVLVNSGGSIYVSHGGMANDIIVDGIGSLCVFSGGAALNIVEDGGYVSIADGATATFAPHVIESQTIEHSMTVHSGTTAISATINSHGFMDVSSGGMANDIIVDGIGSLCVFSGGTALSIVEDGGYVSIADGATATFSPHVIESQIIEHSMTVHSGTTAISTTINSHGFMVVSSGGTANSTIVNSRGHMYVSSGGIANSTIVNRLGELYVSSGGTANSTIVNSWGDLYVSSGGTANSTIVNSWGHMYVSSGGIANSTIVSSGGRLYISSGGTALNIVEDGGNVSFVSGVVATFAPHIIQSKTITDDMTVHSGTTANSLVIGDGYMRVFSGGTALNITEDGGGVEISDGATVTFVPNVIQSKTINIGKMTLHSGTTAISITIKAETGQIARLTVYDSGVVSSVTVEIGRLYISSGGTALDIVEDGGAVFIEDGATVTFIPHVIESRTITSDITVHSGNTANSLTIKTETLESSYRNHMYVYSGGKANCTTAVGFLSMCVSSGGIVDFTTINSGGSLFIYNGGIANNTILNSKYKSSYCTLYVYSGGMANFTTVNGGYLYANGGMANFTTVNGGYLYANGGVANDITINRDGYLDVSSGGTANNITINSRGYLDVFSGGTANDITINEYGRMFISRGGIAEKIRIASGGIIYVSSGGNAQIIGYQSGASISAVSGASIQYGGWSVNNGDTLIVSSSWQFIKTTVASGGYVRAESGGSLADVTTVASGGYLVVNSGAVVSSLILQSGGYVELNDGVTVSMLTLDVGASIGDLVNAGSSFMVMERYSDGVASGKIKDATIGGILSVAPDTELSGLAGQFTLKVNDLSGNYVITGNDFSQVTLDLSGTGMIDLSGNYWGTTDIDAIYDRLGVDSATVRIDNVLKGNPAMAKFALASTSLTKNYLASNQTSITFVFTAEVDATTVSVNAITFESTTGKTVAIRNAIVSGNSLTIDFDEITTEGVYTIRLADTIKDVEGNALSSLLHDGLPVGVGEQLRVTARLTGAAVVKVSPAGDVAGALTAFQIYFSKSVNPATLLDNVRLIAPNGLSVVPTSVRMLNNSTAEFTVQAQTASGKYTVKVLSGVADYAGNLLDQNGNGVSGETTDGYASEFALTEIDLSIKNVVVPKTLTAGEDAIITWNVANESGTALMGSWTDGVYLSTDTQWDIGDTLLATYDHANGLSVGETLSGEALVNLIGVKEGSYYLLVRSDIRNDEDAGVAASVAAQNLVATSINVAVPQLSVGGEVTGSISMSGDHASYRLAQKSGEALQLTLDSHIDAANMELYVGYGYAPTREQYDTKVQRVTDATMTIDAGIMARDVYVLVYARSTSEVFDYTLSATKAPASIDKVTQSGHSVSEPVTLTVTGRNFHVGMTAHLVAADGTVIALDNLQVSGTTKLTATVAANTLASGDYTLELGDGGQMVACSQPISVGAVAGEGRLEYSFYAPSVVGRHQNHMLSLTVSNTGTAAIDAPLVFFIPTQSHADGSETTGAILSLNYDQSAFWIATMPAGYSNSLSFFVNGETSGTIQPGESVSVPIYYTGWLTDDWDFGDSHINWNVSVLYADDSTPLHWSDVFLNSGLSVTTEQELAQAFTDEFGDTWGGYYEMVVGNLRYLNELGYSAVTLEETSSLLRFEAMQKAGVLQPLQTLAEAEDLFLEGISVQRTYAIDHGTIEEGSSFGYGWVFNWDVKLTITSNGDVQIVQGGVRRLYQPTATFGYQTVNRDGSVLKNNATGYRLTDTDGSQWQFDTEGRLIYVVSTGGVRISCMYDADGRLSRLTNTGTGQYVSFTRDAGTGLVTAAKDSTGKTVSYTYSEDGDLLFVTDSAMERLAAYEYYASIEHALTKVTTGGAATAYAYDELGRIVSITNADDTTTLAYGTAGDVTLSNGNRQVTLYYDTNGNIAKITDDKTGKIYKYNFDANGAFVSGCDSDGNALTSQFTFAGQTFDVTYNGVDFSNLTFKAVYNTNINSNHYTVDGITYYKTDKDGNILRQNDKADEYYVAGYDANGNIVSYEYLKDGVTTTYAFNEDGSISISEDDPSQYFVIDGIKYFRKDMEGNVLGQHDTEVDSYTMGYDADGNRVFYAYTLNGETTYYWYDVAGNMVSMTDTEGTTTYTHGADGNKATEIAPDGTLSCYDANGNLTSRTDAEGKVTSYTYDENGNIVSITSDGLTALYDYDADGNLTGYTDVRGNIYAYTYDAAGRQTSVTVNGKTTSYTYDENDNYSSITDANGNTSFYSYNADGVLFQFTDANGNVTTYMYNDTNDLIRITYADGTFEAYSYNGDGELIGWTGRAGQTATYTIDADGNYTGIVYSDGRENTFIYNADGYLLSANDITFFYDPDGNRTSQNFVDGRSIQYTYNADSYVTGYADELGHGVNYTYTVNGQYDVLMDENGSLIVDYDYDMDGNLIKAAYGNGTYTTYTYDDYGQVTAIDNFVSDGTIVSFVHYDYDSEGKRVSMTMADGTWAYTYDAKDQLIGAVFTDNEGTVTQELAYTYDAMGNRLTATENGVTTTYTYNNLNQIVSANGFEYVYDANGNLLEDEKRIYTWTADNRVASETLKSTGQTWEYGYDALGNRVSSTTNGITTSWTVDANGNVLAEYVNGVWNRTYYQGNLLTGFVDNEGNEYFYNADALGTTISVTGADGSSVNTYTYDPWGNVLSSAEGVANDFTFVGGYGLMLNDSGNYFVRARNYNSQTGRWISPDPIGISGGENLYQYCMDNPLSFIDIRGNDVYKLFIRGNASITTVVGVGAGAEIGLAWDDNKNIGVFITICLNTSFGLHAGAGIGLNFETLEGDITVSDLKKIELIDAYKADASVFNFGFGSEWDITNETLTIKAGVPFFEGSILIKQDSTVDVEGTVPKELQATIGLKKERTIKITKVRETKLFNNPQKKAIKISARILLENTVSKIFSEGFLRLWENTYKEVLPKINLSVMSIQKSVISTNSGISERYTKLIFSTKGTEDKIGDKVGISKIYWFVKEDDDQWQNITESVFSEGENAWSYLTDYSGKMSFGIAAVDNDGCYNEIGNLIDLKNGIDFDGDGKNDPIRIMQVSVDTSNPPPIPCLTLVSKNTIGNTTYFTIDASKSKNNYSYEPLKYIWSIGNPKQNSNESSLAQICISVTQLENGKSYEWKIDSSTHPLFDLMPAFNSSNNSLKVYLSVKDSYGTKSLAPASIVLSVTSDISTSEDPNNKTVAEGVGEAGYVQNGTKLSYTIEFENDPEFATAPAQWVRVFDTLDGSKYDLDSFVLEEFCIAGNTFVVGDGRDSFNRTVELSILDYTITATVSINLVTDEDMGITQLVAEFMAVDPESGFMLQDLDNGLLPVNDAFGSGEGHISYTINAWDDLVDGTEITNTAKIYFDFNDPIDTPTTLNTIDANAPSSVALAVSADDNGIITLAMNALDAGSGVEGYNVRWSTDGEHFIDYGYTTYPQLQLAGLGGTTYYFQTQAVDAVGLVSEWSDIQSVHIEGVPTQLIGTATGISWDAVPGMDEYVVEYSIDNFEHFVRIHVIGTTLDSFRLPAGTYQWRVRAALLDEWQEGETIISADDVNMPKLLQSNDDNSPDVFFGKANGVWNGNYEAQHVGIGAWNGTGETAVLDGKNAISDIFAGSDDANVLLLTDDENGDALFIDDIYSAFPEGLDAQARIAKIDEIRAGDGNDIVDLTSQRFDYVGGGMTVHGGLGDDVIWANSGDNTLFGDAGDDRIVGAGGNDVIVGGAGNDSMHGGGGEDIFAFGGMWGKDNVEQLSDGKVTLWFKEGDKSKWDEATLTYKDGENSVKVEGVAIENVTLKFGNDGSAEYGKLLESGAFDEFSSERIFENKNTRGMLA